jgi:acetyltransferase-like isoleucine patch superfamily enzyme
MKLRNIIQRFLHKVAQDAPGGTSLRPWLHKQRGVKIGEHVFISQQVYIDELHPEVVSIGDNSTIGLRTSIFTHFYWGEQRGSEHAGPVTIEKNVFIGPHCVILPGVHIGEGAVVKAGTVVTRNVPAHTFWGTEAATALATVSIPLTWEHEYSEFMRGMRPIRRNKG